LDESTGAGFLKPKAKKPWSLKAFLHGQKEKPSAYANGFHFITL